MLTKQEELWLVRKIEAMKPMIAAHAEVLCAINEVKAAAQKAEEKLRAMAEESYAEARRFGGQQ